MSFSQFHGKAYLIPQVFYKKEMKSKFAKAFWGMLRKALKKSLHYPDFWSLSVMGYPPPLCPKGGGGHHQPLPKENTSLLYCTGPQLWGVGRIRLGSRHKTYP